MKKTLIAATLAGTLGVTGIALLGPAVANAQDASPGTGRLEALKDALQSLVSDGTLTSAQADKVATTLDQAMPMHRGGMGRHMGGRGMIGPETIAGILGITVDELHEARQDGKTLAEIAKAEGMAKATLIDKLVAAHEKRLAEAVTAGRLTHAQADERKADLREHLTAMVDREMPGPGGRLHGPGMDGPGMNGPGMHRGWGAADVPPSSS